MQKVIFESRGIGGGGGDGGGVNLNSVAARGQITLFHPPPCLPPLKVPKSSTAKNICTALRLTNIIYLS